MIQDNFFLAFSSFVNHSCLDGDIKKTGFGPVFLI